MRVAEASRTEEDPAYLREQLITYIGSKRSLLPAIGQAVEQLRGRLDNRRLRAADLFSGSGVVARALKQHCEHLLVNDLERYASVVNRCYLSNRSEVDQVQLAEQLIALRNKLEQERRPGFLAKLYAPSDDEAIEAGERVFYTRENAVTLDTARQLIGELPASEQAYFLAPLLAQASVHANTAGVFKGFYKNAEGVGQFGGSGRNALKRILGTITLEAPLFSRFECAVDIRQTDANTLVDELNELDLVYLDPPYNQHPYGSNYFMLNLLVDYEQPDDISQVSGIPKDWQRSDYYRRAQAPEQLFGLIETIPARFILLSYNSEGFIERASLEAELARHGRFEVQAIPYNTFRGSRNLRQRPIHVQEYLYLLEKG